MIAYSLSLEYTERVDGRSGHHLRAQRYFCTDWRICLVSHCTQQWSFSQSTKETILCSLLHCRPAVSWRWFSHVTGFTVFHARCAGQQCCTMMIILVHMAFSTICPGQLVHSGTGPPGLLGVNGPIYSYGCGTLLPHVRLLARSAVHKGP